MNRFRIFALLSLCWMIVIFAYSAKNAERSTKDSNEIVEIIGEIVVEDFDELPPEEKQEFIDKTDHIVRKMAHGLEYTLLGVLLLNAGLGLKNRKKWLVALVSLVIGSAYAASDEFHQLFVPGRAGMVTDWMIDTGGVIFGIIMVLVTGLIITAVKGGKHEHDTGM
ncbi:MAG: VanZ family protein [Lachnospiraceae bacterium]|nr:VanZ family protein [Lachnospiraceae bacterium]